MSTSKNTMAGGCLCGNVRYDLVDIESETLDGTICHCKVSRRGSRADDPFACLFCISYDFQTCRRLNTVLSYNTMIDAKQLKISKGDPKVRSFRSTSCVTFTERCSPLRRMRTTAPTRVAVSYEPFVVIVVQASTLLRIRFPARSSSKPGHWMKLNGWYPSPRL